MKQPPVSYKPRRFYRAKIEILYIVAADPMLEPPEVEVQLKDKLRNNVSTRAMKNLWVEEISSDEFHGKYLWEDISIGED